MILMVERYVCDIACYTSFDGENVGDSDYVAISQKMLLISINLSTVDLGFLWPSIIPV